MPRVQAGGGIRVTYAVLTLQATLLKDNVAPSGATLDVGVGSTAQYLLPAPPGHWVPATKCEIWREAEADDPGCAMNHTENVDACQEGGTGSAACPLATESQPCNWRKDPSLLGEEVYVLPLGAHDDALPTPCSIGLLGGNGSDARQQTSAKCAGLCPAGKFCAEEATVQPSLCPKGRYCPQGTATPLPCEAGTFGDAAGLSGADQCTPTSPGSYATAGSTEQTACSPGSYAPDAGMAACQRCKAGTYQSEERATACANCKEHSWCAAGSSAPTACESGTMGGGLGLTNQSECLPCPAGSWCSAGRAIPCGVNTFQPLLDKDYAGACKQCPEDAESPEASISIEACKCRPGYYDSKPAANEVACEACTIGSTCPTVGTTTAPLNITAGWYRTASYSADLRRCPDASNEESGCIGGIGDEGPCKPCAAS